MANAYQTAEANRRRLENSYHRALTRITRDIRTICQQAATPSMLTAAIEAYSRSDAFQRYAELTARRMITGQLVGQKATWRAAAAESMRGRDIYRALREETRSGTRIGQAINDIIANNALLIETCPLYISRRLSAYAYQQAQKGIRHEQMMEAMRRMAPHLTDVQVRRIARTESSKAQTALLEARCEALGLGWYEWRSSHDERVRSSHSDMDGVICRWNDPPNPELLFPHKGERNSGAGYHPGNIYNCRCIALPIIDEHDLHFPCRVCDHNKIITVGSLPEFEKLFGSVAA